MTILEQISSDTIVFLQTHKRIWPASQRDALFWSHMKNIREKGDPNANDEWLVCNHSIELDAYPANVGKCVRIFLTVIMFCQTYVHPSVVAAKGNKITRDDLTCKITYCSTGMYIALSMIAETSQNSDFDSVRLQWIPAAGHLHPYFGRFTKENIQSSWKDSPITL